MSSAPDIRLSTQASGAGFAAQMQSWQGYMERALSARLPAADIVPRRLHAAMRYSVLGGGKRVRPILVFCTARALGLREAQVEGVACAIELIHAYSLVHDDLPAMDDDAMRRGKPTCHKAYDEATAVLVGDALQSLAFKLLASDQGLPAGPAIRLKLIDLLAEACGTHGMAGGQAMDVAVQGYRPPIAEVELMYACKTGALIRAGVMMAAACAPELGARLRSALGAFATPIGLAFQIQDDLLDVVADAVTLGKATGADRAHDRPTYPAVLGVEEAQQRVQQLHTEALAALRPFGSSADSLRFLADWLLMRSY